MTLIFLSNKVLSQDLLVTTQGDSLNCKVYQVKGGFVYFALDHEGRGINTLMPAQQAQIIKYDFFPDMVSYSVNLAEMMGYAKYRTAINLGYSRSLTTLKNIPFQLQEFAAGLQRGFNLGIDFAGFFSEELGLGVKYSLFNTSNSMSSISAILPDGTNFSGGYSNDVNVHYVGPTFNIRALSSNKRGGLYAQAGAGYLRYTNKEMFRGPKSFIYPNSGNTIGLNLALSYDAILSDNFAIGFQVSFLAGGLKNVDIKMGNTTQTVRHEVGLSRLDFTIGFRIIN